MTLLKTLGVLTVLVGAAMGAWALARATADPVVEAGPGPAALAVPVEMRVLETAIIDRGIVEHADRVTASLLGLTEGEFLVHSTWLGAVGGIGGTAAGVVITAAMALLADTVPVVDLRIVLAGPLIGAGAGLLAGVYPATRAAGVPPAQALRSI